MKKLVLAVLVLALPAATAAPLLDTDCIPDGYDFPLPDGPEFPPLEWEVDPNTNNFPTGGEVLPGSVKAFESDLYFDDEIGDGSVGEFSGTGNESVEFLIENWGGDLTGPDGEYLNGFGEGDCIEVYLTYVLTFDAEFCETGTISIKPFGVGGSVTFSTCYDVKRTKLVKTPVKDVCPC